VKKSFTHNLEDGRAETQEEQPVEPEVHHLVDQAEQSAVVVNAPSLQKIPDTTAATEPPQQL
jgi:hypothetical protein